MNWIIKYFNELSVNELYALLQLRSKVFVVEQQCPYLDPDDKDQQAAHLLGFDETGKLLACARLLPAGISYKECSVGRVATDLSVRKTGFGRELMQRAIDFITQEWQAAAIRISAQEYLLNFYSSMNFIPTSEVYLEDNIPHVEMLLRLHPQ